MILCLIFVLCSLIGGSFSKNDDVSNIELKKLSEELFDKITTNLYDQISVNYQGKIGGTNSNDVAPERLINATSQVLESVKTIKLMRKLYNNYNLEVWKNETDTAEENAEEDEFISALLDTDVMLHAMKFLADKGFIKHDTQEFRRILKLMWFNLYPRRKNVYGSSGFEHVYLTEKKTTNKIIGLHSWVYFAEEELRGKLNYLGYTRQVLLNDKAALASVEFTYDGIRKGSSFFIGTPPEIEIALYTVCFHVKPGKSCRFYTKGKTFSIQTYVMKSQGNNLVASAYPRF